MQSWWADKTFFKNIWKSKTNPKLLNGNVNIIGLITHLAKVSKSTWILFGDTVCWSLQQSQLRMLPWGYSSRQKGRLTIEQVLHWLHWDITQSLGHCRTQVWAWGGISSWSQRVSFTLLTRSPLPCLTHLSQPKNSRMRMWRTREAVWSGSWPLREASVRMCPCLPNLAALDSLTTSWQLVHCVDGADWPGVCYPLVLTALTATGHCLVHLQTHRDNNALITGKSI